MEQNSLKEIIVTMSGFDTKRFFQREMVKIFKKRCF